MFSCATIGSLVEQLPARKSAGKSDERTDLCYRNPMTVNGLVRGLRDQIVHRVRNDILAVRLIDGERLTELACTARHVYNISCIHRPANARICTSLARFRRWRHVDRLVGRSWHMVVP